MSKSVLLISRIGSSWASGAGPLGLGLLVFIVVCGCGKPDYMKETAPVSGVVTLDGKPVESGYIFVSPSIGRMAKGTIAEDGTFTLGTYGDDDGAQVGTHPVMIAPVPLDEGGRRKPKKDIPAKYGSAGTSDLEITVEPGTSNTVEFNLTSGE